jgi:hypothetical protein
VLASLLALLAWPVAAWSDSDPPSDTLIQASVYSPYTPRVSAGAGRVLDKVVADAKRAGYPIRVALVAGQADLGSVPDLLGQPLRYAKFLQSEITFNSKRPLLVAQPSGWGSVDAGPKAAALLASLPPPGANADGLAGAAAIAVARLATAAGHPVATPHVALAPAARGSSSRASSTPWWVFVAPLLLVAIGVAVLSRRRGEPGDEPPPTST